MRLTLAPIAGFVLRKTSTCPSYRRIRSLFQEHQEVRGVHIGRVSQHCMSSLDLDELFLPSGPEDFMFTACWTTSVTIPTRPPPATTSITDVSMLFADARSALASEANRALTTKSCWVSSVSRRLRPIYGTECVFVFLGAHAAVGRRLRRPSLTLQRIHPVLPPTSTSVPTSMAVPVSTRTARAYCTMLKNATERKAFLSYQYQFHSSVNY